MVQLVSIDCDFFDAIDNGDSTGYIDFDCTRNPSQSSNNSCAPDNEVGVSYEYTCDGKLYIATLIIRYKKVLFTKRLKVYFRHEIYKLNTDPEDPKADLDAKPVKVDRNIIANWSSDNNRTIGRHYESFDGFSNGLFNGQGGEGLHFGTNCLDYYHVTASIKYKDKCDGTTRQLGPITLRSSD